MELKRISINTASPELPTSKVLIIYTGGTFGMVKDKTGSLIPFDFSLILEHLPTLRSLSLELTVISFARPIDSSNIKPEHWVSIGNIIVDNYTQHDGFVVLHGTDTMAFTASALSFMLQGLNKPVIFTGAQLPIAEPRSDARENLITALEIASAKKDGQAIVPEVCIYFGSELLRGNRSKKAESQHFDAFQSENYPILAEAGVVIDFNTKVIRSAEPAAKLKLLNAIDARVSVLKLFPGISQETVEHVLRTPNLRGLVLETFGSGNAPTDTWLESALQNTIKQGVVVVNISQCPGGMVEQGKYETSKFLNDIGVLSGRDMTLEAAVTKLMVALGQYKGSEVKAYLAKSVAGELTA
jgi:L-asparaginase